MSPDLLLYIAQFLAAGIYAAVLELVLRRRYEPGYTWVTVVVGTAIVGLLVAARLAWASLPTLTGAELAWWVWWLWFWSFVASGLPIVVWQVALQEKRVRRAMAAWARWGER